MEMNGDGEFKLEQTPSYERLLSCTCRECETIKPDKLVFLPCLHVVCSCCVHAGVHWETALFSCPVCGYMVHIRDRDNVAASFKAVPKFLRPGEDTGRQLNDRPRKTSAECDQCRSSGTTTAELLHCKQCDKMICADCVATDHQHHSVIPMLNYIQDKMDYIRCLIGDIEKKIARHQESISAVTRVKHYLASTKEEVKKNIVDRAAYLIDLIQQRQQRLLEEVDERFGNCAVNYDRAEQKYKEQLQQFEFIRDFSNSLLKGGCQEDILSYHDEVSDQCLRQIHQVPDADVDILSVRLDVPSRGKEQASLEKLFGALKEGMVLFDNARQHASFNVDIIWPTSITQSPTTKEVVITGKTGALDSEGKALFFDGRGKLTFQMTFDAQHAPLDVLSGTDGTVWLSNSTGEVKNLSVAGHVLHTVSDVFQGSGRLAILSDGSLAVSSNADKEVKVLDEVGNFVRSIKIEGLDSDKGTEQIQINSMTCNSDDMLVISDANGCRVIGFSAIDGQLRFVYDTSSSSGAVPMLKCPSAVCCDPFDNILVADFTGNNIHLLSKSGQFLGCLLNNKNGVSCPNCLALDTEGHLYVGQYGGDILVFSYINWIKKA